MFESPVLLLEHFALLICLGLFLRSQIVNAQERRSQRWWHVRQSEKLHHEAEAIRNGLLQELFVLRRGLEVFLESHQFDNHKFKSHSAGLSCEILPKMERFHRSLTELSDRLSPPYLDDSLPHAIRNLGEGWKTSYPLLSIHLSVPTQWPTEPYSHHRAIVLLLDELFYSSVTELPALSGVTIHLQQHNSMGKLNIRFTQSQSSLHNQIHPQAFSCIQQIFQGLTDGHCSCRYQGLNIRWDLTWMVSPLNSD